MALNDSAVCDCLTNGHIYIELKKRKLLLIQKKVLPLPPLTSNGLSCGVMVTQQILVLSFWVRVPAAQLIGGYFGNLFFVAVSQTNSTIESLLSVQAPQNLLNKEEAVATMHDSLFLMILLQLQNSCSLEDIIYIFEVILQGKARIQLLTGELQHHLLVLGKQLLIVGTLRHCTHRHRLYGVVRLLT